MISTVYYIGYIVGFVSINNTYIFEYILIKIYIKRDYITFNL